MSNIQQNINNMISLAGLLYSQTPMAEKQKAQKVREVEEVKVAAEHAAKHKAYRTEYDVLASQVPEFRIKGSTKDPFTDTKLAESLRTRKAAFEKGQLAYSYAAEPDPDFYAGLTQLEGEIGQLETLSTSRAEKKKTDAAIQAHEEKAAAKRKKQNEATAAAQAEAEAEADRLAKSAARTKILSGVPTGFGSPRSPEETLNYKKMLEDYK